LKYKAESFAGNEPESNVTRGLNMKNFKVLVTSALLLGAIALSVPGFAGGDMGGDRYDWKHHGERGHGHGDKRLEKLLDLTDAQKETLKTQRDANKVARDALYIKIADTRESLANAVENGANDAELAALAETLGKLHAEQALAGAKAHKAFVAVLTDEQKQKLAELKTKREERRKSRADRSQSSSAASVR